MAEQESYFEKKKQKLHQEAKNQSNNTNFSGDQINKQVKQAVNSINKSVESIKESSKEPIQLFRKFIGIIFMLVGGFGLFIYTLLATKLIEPIPATGDASYLSVDRFVRLITLDDKNHFLIYTIGMLATFIILINLLITGFKMYAKNKHPFFKYLKYTVVFTLICLFTLVSWGGICIARDFEMKTTIEKSQFSYSGKLLKIEEMPELIGGQKTKEYKGLDFIHIKKDRIYSNGIYITIKESKDSLFHIYQKLSASGIDKNIAVKRASQIISKLELKNGILFIEPRFSSPEGDGFRFQNVELIIEQGIGKRIEYKGKSGIFNSISVNYEKLYSGDFQAP